MKLELELHVTVHKPLEEVFYAFIDPEYTTKVDPPTRSAKLVRGSGFGKGDVWELEIDAGLLGTIRQRRTYLEVDAPRRFQVEVAQKGLRGPDDQGFEAVEGGGIRVTWKPSYDVTGLMALLFPIVKRQVRSKGKLWMKRMKRAIERDQYVIRLP